MQATRVIGVPVPRVEGPEKVTGRTRYTADVHLPGMLHARILRSPYAHARIRRIDASRAWNVPGVRAVVTGPDVEGHYVGKVMRDMPVLCWDRVRFIGDRVAAVAAETPDAADAALRAIEVEYEELPAVFDPIRAMESDAPLLHDDPAGYGGAPIARLATDVRNGATRLAWAKGDVARGFAAAERIFEHTFRVPSRHQGYLEPHATIVDLTDGGRIEVWAACKAPFRARIQLAQAIGVPEEQIRVNVVAVGGDFGGKGDAVDAPIVYYLARQAGRPVKLVESFTEELMASNPTHLTVVTIRSGVAGDGRLVARWARTVHASGAYAALKPNAALSTWHYVGGPYRVPHASFEFLQIYTNTVPGGYFRAPGAHQFTFALECHTDIMARELGIDPVEFRLRNLITEGEEDAVGVQVHGIKAREVLLAAVAETTSDGQPTTEGDRASPRPGAGVAVSPVGRVTSPTRPGRGVALFGRQIGGGAGGSVLTAAPDGTLTVLSPTVDQGTGTHTIVRQLVADDMGVPLDAVRVIIGDTDTAPFDEGPRASRVTYTEGQAVLQAGAELRARLREPAAQLLDCAEEAVSYRDGAFWGEGRQVSLAAVVASAAGGQPITVRVQVDAPQVEDVTYFCAQIADVDVDPETGEVRVRRLVSAHDVGPIINPITHQGQIDGSVVTGIGLALTEELVMDGGRIMNPSLGDYKLPTVVDVPSLQTVLVTSGGGTGPHGAKAIGEHANNSPPAAIANAVADAVGVHLFELPLTADRLYRALHGEGTDAP